MGSAPLASLGLGDLSPAVKHRLISPAKDALAECAEFMEMFQASYPEMQPCDRVLDVFPDRIL